MRRVAVTGMGVISPVGNDRSSFWNNLIAGKNGIGLLTRFAPREQKVKVAAQVEDFDPVQYMERAQVRKTDLFSQYAMQFCGAYRVLFSSNGASCLPIYTFAPYFSLNTGASYIWSMCACVSTISVTCLSPTKCSIRGMSNDGSISITLFSSAEMII